MRRGKGQTHMRKIFVLGSLNMDITVVVQSLPSRGETTLAAEFRMMPGGKGANQAVAAARCGANVKMVGRVGEDQYGEALLSNMLASGVDTSHVVRDRTHSTGCALITVDSLGSNTIVVYPGANSCCTAHDVEAASEELSRSDAIIAQLEIPLETVEHAFRVAKQTSVITVLNPSPVRSLGSGLLANTDCIIVNEVEATAILGFPVNSLDEAAIACRRLQEKGPRVAIVTLGDRGTVLAGPDGICSVPAFPVRAVDSTGAGDAFVAAFTVSWLEGATLGQALRWACAAGALATTRLGAQAALPSRSEIMKLTCASKWKNDTRG